MMVVLEAAGPQAAHIGVLWWWMFWTCALVFVAVIGFLGWAVARAPRADASSPPDIEPAARGESRLRISVAAGVAVSSAMLIALLVASIFTDRALATLPIDDALSVHIIAHDWWWEVVYDDPIPARVFTTANELYVPVGRAVVVTLDADDVIHSLWIANLHGKKDLIPGRTTTLRLRADRAGTFAGRCAEFCGLQHAHMMLDVVAVDAAAFERWSALQREPAPIPGDPKALRGRELFTSGSCMLCHAIRGTSANAHKAPDLTHMASRARLAAGLVPNTPQSLAAWIMTPQTIKPGVNMPDHRLDGDDLAALVAYLGTLK